MSGETKPITTITHISDFHLPISGKIPLFKLLSKRMLGWANLTFNRGKTHQQDPFFRLLDHLVAQRGDCCVATGDFVNLALDQEFAYLAALFNQCGFTEQTLFCIPGNHDRYTPGAQLRGDFEKHFAAWLPFPNAPRQYPTFKTVGHAAIIGLNTAVWRGPIRAAGRLPKRQLRRLKALLDSLPPGLTPLIAMHHPPFSIGRHGVKQYLDGMQRFEPLMDLLQHRNAVVIHGHIHVLSDRMCGDVRVIGVPSASNDIGKSEKQLAYNTLRIGPNGLIEALSTRYWPERDVFDTITLNETAMSL
ncbi:MAG: metallophosphoesterase [Deltaproteobacteria bacterium]|nr:metallophosphoesterase [Deltaproteobacteria bacterium]